MKLRFPLLLTFALLSSAAQATTLSGIGIIEPITITLEDLDVNDNVTPQAVDTVEYEATAEFAMQGTSGWASDYKLLNYGFGFFNLGLDPALTNLTVMYSGGNWGGFNLQANFSSAGSLKGYVYHQRQIEVSPMTRIRIKTKATVQGYVDTGIGPNIPDDAELALGTTISLKHLGSYVGSKVFHKTLTPLVGMVFQEEDVEFVFENTTTQPTTLQFYYDLQHDGYGAYEIP